MVNHHHLKWQILTRLLTKIDLACARKMFIFCKKCNILGTCVGIWQKHVQETHLKRHCLISIFVALQMNDEALVDSWSLWSLAMEMVLYGSVLKFDHHIKRVQRVDEICCCCLGRVSFICTNNNWIYVLMWSVYVKLLFIETWQKNASHKQRDPMRVMIIVQRSKERAFLAPPTVCFKS